MTAFTMGAVAYDPKVVTIWEGFKEYFFRRGLAFDYVLYSNYERQVESHLAGHFHVAWNSPLAWVRTRRLAAARGRKVEAVAMRDTDRDLTSVVVVRNDSGIQSVADLRGKKVAVGAIDSPQATLLPLSHLRAQGLAPRKDFEVFYNDLLGGKHGDHIGGERDAAKALRSGEADAACVIDSNLLLFGREGVLPSGSVRVVGQTAPYDHCNLTAGPGVDASAFLELLLGMSYGDDQARPLLDLEGLKQWLPGRTDHYTGLAATEFYAEDGGLRAPGYRP